MIWSPPVRRIVSAGAELSRFSRVRERVLAAVVAAVVLVTAGASSPAQAQVTGTGGTTGTSGSSSSDVFLGIQKVKNVNLNDLDRAIFLNRASCECKRTAWIKAVLNPSALAKAAQIPSTNRVTMWLGNNCDNMLYTPLCHPLYSTSFSDFRLNGILVMTDVSVIAQSYGSVVSTTGSGGSSGGGGTSGSGSGGATGAGGAAGGMGSGGEGGSSGSNVEIPPDEATKALCGKVVDGFTQTLWLFVGSNEGKNDTISASMPLAMDVVPPPAPANVNVSEANEALVVSWEAVDKTITSDLQGYQVFCTRADQYQVFGDGTFSTSIDTCGDTVSDGVPTAIQDRNTHFICSDFLSVSETSYRVKILENNIWYGVGVAAVDRQGNASPITPAYDHPVQTLDFYHQYRNGNPQGAATGGACAVAGEPASGGVVAGLAATSIALTVLHRRRRSRRRSEAPGGAARAMGQPS